MKSSLGKEAEGGLLERRGNVSLALAHASHVVVGLCPQVQAPLVLLHILQDPRREGLVLVQSLAGLAEQAALDQVLDRAQSNGGNGGQQFADQLNASTSFACLSLPLRVWVWVWVMSKTLQIMRTLHYTLIYRRVTQCH